VPVRVWFVALFVYKAAAVAVPNLTKSAYERRSRTRGKDQMSLKLPPANTLREVDYRTWRDQRKRLGCSTLSTTEREIRALSA